MNSENGHRGHHNYNYVPPSPDDTAPEIPASTPGSLDDTADLSKAAVLPAALGQQDPVATQQYPASSTEHTYPDSDNTEATANYQGSHRHHHKNEKRSARWVAASGALAIVAGGGILAWQQGWFDNKKPAGIEATTPTSKPTPSESPTKTNTETVPLVLPAEFDKSGKEDLITDGTWRYLPGATQDDNKLKVRKIGLQLRKQADAWTGKPSQYIANPSQNVYGTRLKTGGDDFGLGVQVSGITDKNPAVINFNSEPDELYDEKRHYEPKVQVTVGDTGMTVSIWQGSGPKADEKKTIAFDKEANSVGFTMQQKDDQVIVAAGGKKVAFEADMYQSSKQVVIGFDGGNYTVDQMAAYPAEQGAKVEMVDTSEARLAPLAQDGLQKLVAGVRPDLKIGIATNMRPVTEYPAVAKAYGENASVLQPEMDMKPQAIYTGKVNQDGTLNAADFHWEAADAFKKLAHDNGREYNVHTPFFAEALPRGFEEFLLDTIDGQHTKKEFDTFMESWAEPYFGRFQDARAIDVINEPLADTSIFDIDGATLNNNLWARASKKVSGDQRYYMKKGFQLARQYAGPSTKLYLNDNGMEADNDRVTVAINLAEYINAGSDKKLIDGVRLQAHIDDSDMETLMGNARGDRERIIAVRENAFHMLARFAANNLGTEISEFSIDSEDGHRKELFAEGFLRAVLQSRNTSGFQVWSPVNGPDGFTTEIDDPSDGYGLSYGNDGLWNFNDDTKSVTETPVMRGLRNAVEG